MAFLFGKSPGPLQALDKELAPHKALFRNYDRTKEDMTALLKQFPNLTPTMHNFGGTSLPNEDCNAVFTQHN